MASILWREHADSRQATKLDLLDIAKALGCVVNESIRVPELRALIRAALLRSQEQAHAIASRPCASREHIQDLDNPGRCLWCGAEIEAHCPDCGMTMGTLLTPGQPSRLVCVRCEPTAADPEECEDNDCAGCSWCDRQKESEQTQ